MDHLPLPDCPHRPIKIPYLGGIYDGLGFSDYPARNGWDILTLYQASCPWVHFDLDEGKGLQDVIAFFELLGLYTLLKDDRSNQEIIGEALACLQAISQMISDAVNKAHIVQQILPGVVENFGLIYGPGVLEELMHIPDNLETQTLNGVFTYLWGLRQVCSDEGRLTGVFETTCSLRILQLLVMIWLANYERPDGDCLEDAITALRQHPLKFPFTHLDSIYEDKTSQDVDKFLQTWLFFGTLDQVFSVIGIKVELKDFISADETPPFITTKALERHIEDWRSREKDIPAKTLYEHSRSILDVLDEAARIATELENPDRSSKLQSSSLTCSVLVLCYTLRQAAISIYKLEQSLPRNRSDFLRSRFAEDGWCSNQISMIESSWHLPFQYYLYLLGPPRVKRDHQKCTKELCEAVQINDEEDYEVKHLPNDPCTLLMGFEGLSEPYFEPSLDEVISIIESGDIPLVSVRHPISHTTLIQPEIVRFEPGSGMQYVAISHVWADGLGNPHRNRLPLCQLFALKTLLGPHMSGPDGQIPERICFWIDTICIPLKPREARTSAICSLYKVYEGALAVLALDQELLERDIPSTSLECLALILSTNWARRLWTFQEAVLGNLLMFHFANKSQLAIQIFSEISSSKESPTHTNMKFLAGTGSLLEELDVGWFIPFNFLDPSNPEPQDSQIVRDRKASSRFLRAWSGLCWRSTSKPEDETTCVGALLGFKLDEILNAPNESHARMKKLLLLQSKFPRDISFVKGPRIDVDGFLWAPASFLAHSSAPRMLRYEEELATLGPEGLIFQHAGIFLSLNATSVTLVDQKHYVVLMESDHKSNSAIGKSNTVIEDIVAYEIVPELVPGGSKVTDLSKSLAIIIATSAPLPLPKMATGVLGNIVEIEEEKDAILHVKFICVISINRISIGRTFGSYLKPAATDCTESEIFKFTKVAGPNQ